MQFGMWKMFLGGVMSAGALSAAYGQVRPSDETTALISQVTGAFFEQMLVDDFAAERTFMTDVLTNLMSRAEWRDAREYVIETAGATPRYRAHGLTYYTQESLLAAVDFSGQGLNANTYVCGYLLWEIPHKGEAALSRIEQNVVSGDLFQQMPKQEAAQLMTNWRCPRNIVEAVLGG